jgi:hypothetical protein
MEKYRKSHREAPCKDIDEFKNKLAGKEVQAWYEVKHVIVDEKNNIISNVLKSKSPYFHPEMRDKKDSAPASESAQASR